MTVKEIWRDIPEYRGYYQASTLGRIRSVDRVIIYKNGCKRFYKGVIKAQRPGSHDYWTVTLGRNSQAKTYTVHKLITLTFLGPCPEGQRVRHGLNGGLDNSLANLCYGTVKQDHLLDKRRDGAHGGRAVIRSDGRYFESLAMAAEETVGTTRQCIGAMCRGANKIKDSGGFKWRYADPNLKLRNGLAVPVVSSDGSVYLSMSAAAQDKGVSRELIRRACQGRRTACGLTWRRVL